MKRGGTDHPKTLALAQLLGIDKWGAVGILECLWHYTAKYSVLGDIGKWSDASIATAIGWKSEPEVLIEALVAAGFVDRCQLCRLVVHDWQEHADNAARKYWKTKGLEPCIAIPPDPEDDSVETSHNFSGKVSQLAAMAMAKTMAKAHSVSIGSEDKDLDPGSSTQGKRLSTKGDGQNSKPRKSRRWTQSDIETIRNAYPRKVAPENARKAIEKALVVVSKRNGVDDPVAWLTQRVELYAKARHGEDQNFTPHPATWFNAGRYDDDESEWSPKAHEKTPRELTPEEREALRQKWEADNERVKQLGATL